ncbi:MAG: T9SS type A sorting domain-containing protein [Bacteroidia bacterium]|nr:T9SS type A sorting domain-containing protein [Bacteroidia bacterium]
MRNIVLIILMVAGKFFCVGQGIGNIWITGYDADYSYPYGLTQWDFNGVTPEFTYIDGNPPVGLIMTNTSICKENGELLFYSNGFAVMNSGHDTIENGLILTPSMVQPYIWNGFWDVGLQVNQSVLALPFPEHSGEYSLFESIPYKNQSNGWGYCPKLLYNKVDMNANDGRGAVTVHGLSLIQDSLTGGQITGCKHANGRDWWVLIPRTSQDAFYSMLLTPEEAVTVDSQHIGQRWFNKGSNGQACFSPDGSKYAFIFPGDEGGDTLGQVFLFDFDRCTGRLSNRRMWDIPLYDSTFTLWGAGGGIAFSPNSRYLYANSGFRIFQYDTEVANVAASEVLVAYYDGFVSPSPTGFFFMQLAPNGKIYLCTGTSVDVAHVIENPDIGGLGCNVNQHGAQLMSYNWAALPNHPNFYLGPLVGSGCDTLTTEIIPPAPFGSAQGTGGGGVKVYPNPARDRLLVEMPGSCKACLATTMAFALMDIHGREVLRQSLTEEKTTIPVVHLPEGVYIYRIKTDKEAYYGKVVIQR